MIVWINGPFGGGKTQTAHELHRRLPGSFICDPEQIGFGLHRALPPSLRRDFQNLPAWRQGVYEVLDRAASEYDAALIVPMTLVEPSYFQQTVGRLRERGHDVRHFALLAERETVVRRLRERVFGRTVQLVLGRGAALRRESFALRNLDRCLDRLRGPEFAEHIWTDQLPIEQVADRIAASAGLALGPPDPVAARRVMRRTWVGLRHIRLR